MGLLLFLGVHSVFHVLAGLESGSLGGLDLDLLAGAGIAAGAGGAGANLKGAKADQLDLSVLDQAFNDTIQRLVCRCFTDPDFTDVFSDPAFPQFAEAIDNRRL